MAPMFRSLTLALLAALFLAGCEADPGPASDPVVEGAGKKRKRHAHDWSKPGSHGGVIVIISQFKYYAEVVFEKDGLFRMYLLGSDWRKILEVHQQVLRASVQPEAGERVSIEIKPDPQKEDAKGMTSRFVGRLPKELLGQKVRVAIENLTIGEERFGPPFLYVPVMPAKVEDEEERKLYLTPGGLYTAADIRANGNVTATQKYRSFHSTHDFNPKPGEKVCPVTRTKADAKCTWIVGGKTYEFCCPPCIDEFVKQAKEEPETIKLPQEYVKKK